MPSAGTPVVRARRVATALLVVLGVALVPGVAAAQHRAAHRRNSSSSATSIPERRTFAHQEHIEAGYDEASGYSKVSLGPMVIAEKPELDLTVLFVMRGREPTVPPLYVAIGIEAHDAGTRFIAREERGLSFTLDGSAVVRWGTMNRVLDTLNGRPREMLELRTSPHRFLRLVNARRVSGRLGATRLTLSDEQLEALRDFASRMDPSGYARALADASDPTRDWYDQSDVDVAIRPQLVSPPPYPDIPDSARTIRRVTIEYIVDTTGHVELGTLHGRAPGRDSAFVEAVRSVAGQWEFTPATRHGRHVRQRVLQLIVFTPARRAQGVATDEH